jgi:hypothetical protein
MVRSVSCLLPADLGKTAILFDQWRATRSLGQRIPDRLWKRACRLACKYGVSRVASALRVGYYQLKKRLDRTSHQCELPDHGDVNPRSPRHSAHRAIDSHPTPKGRRIGPPPMAIKTARSWSDSGVEVGCDAPLDFVEFPTDKLPQADMKLAAVARCVLHLERDLGSRMRVELHGLPVADLAVLLRSVWEAGR